MNKKINKIKHGWKLRSANHVNEENILYQVSSKSHQALQSYGADKICDGPMDRWTSVLKKICLPTTKGFSGGRIENTEIFPWK